jgi:hypothetical protein
MIMAQPQPAKGFQVIADTAYAGYMATPRLRQKSVLVLLRYVSQHTTSYGSRHNMRNNRLPETAPGFKQEIAPEIHQIAAYRRWLVRLGLLEPHPLEKTDHSHSKEETQQAFARHYQQMLADGRPVFRETMDAMAYLVHVVVWKEFQADPDKPKDIPLWWFASRDGKKLSRLNEPGMQHCTNADLRKINRAAVRVMPNALLQATLRYIASVESLNEKRGHTIILWRDDFTDSLMQEARHRLNRHHHRQHGIFTRDPAVMAGKLDVLLSADTDWRVGNPEYLALHPENHTHTQLRRAHVVGDGQLVLGYGTRQLPGGKRVAVRGQQPRNPRGQYGSDRGAFGAVVCVTRAK